MIFIYIFHLKYVKKLKRLICLGTSLLKSKEDLDIRSEDRQESVRMKQFHEKLRLQPVPSMQ